jgi:hypothetical protein
LIKRNLAAEFKGEVELEYHPDGLECTIYAPAHGLGLTESEVDWIHAVEDFDLKRQSWKPSTLIAFWILCLDRLYGGSLSGRTTPIACQGPNWSGSLLPAASPAKAWSFLFTSDLKM